MTVAKSRSTADRRRADAIASGMKVFADRGLTTAAVQRIADDIGVSQPYVFRLFGSKRALFLACLDELEARLREVFHRTVAARQADPPTARSAEAPTARSADSLPALRASFRQMIADGVVTGLWLQACAAARTDEVVAARCRSLIAAVLEETGHLTGATAEELTASLANAALVVMLQALGVDLGSGSAAAVESLGAGEVNQ
jgi:AcrR family transcriptional regulator